MVRSVPSHGEGLACSLTALQGMKYALCFLGGMLFAIYLFPPQPTVEVDIMTRREIAYEVLDLLEEGEYDILESKRIVVEGKNSWF
jgi:hypothetical protein